MNINDLFGPRIRARQLRSLGRLKDAIASYREAVLASPDDPTLRVELTTVLSDAGQHRAAVREADEARRLAPTFGDAHYALAYALASAGRLRRALPAAREAVAIDPQDAHNQSLLASICAALNRWPEADAASAAALAIDPQHSVAVATRATVLRATGRADEANAALAAQLGHDAADVNAHEQLGWHALRDGRRREAIAHFQEALRLRPSEESARRGLTEAIRARSPVYGLLFRFITYAADHRLGWLLAVWVALLMAPRFIVRIDPSSPVVRQAAEVVRFAFFAFSLLWMLLGPIGTALLYADRDGRASMTPDERRHGRWQVAALIVFWLAAVASPLARGVPGLIVILTAAITCVGVHGVFGLPEGRQRRIAAWLVGPACAIAWLTALAPFALLAMLLADWPIRALRIAAALTTHALPIVAGAWVVASFADDVVKAIASRREVD